MSYRIVSEVFANAPVDLALLERVVLLSLAESANQSDRVARHNSSAEKIADRIGSTPPSVRNALSRLKQRGLIVPQIEKCRKGQAQQWLIPQLTEATRRAVWESATPQLRNTPTRNPAKRNSLVALKVVDNP